MAKLDPSTAGKKVKGCRKCGRNKKKSLGSQSPLALFVKNKITAQAYFTQAGLKVKHEK